MSRKLSYIKFCLILLILPGIWAQQGNPGSGFAGLLVAPTRVVFEGRTRVVEMYLVNNSESTKTYAIGFENFRIAASGAMERTDEPEDQSRSANDLLRITPRRVVLEPKKQQVVRLQLVKSSGLTDGEYRSSIVFKIIPDSVADDVLASSPQEGISVNLIPVYGVVIPVIVRIGTTSAAVSLVDMVYSAASGSDAPSLSFSILRSGNRSVYGDIEVSYRAPGRKPIVVGRRKGLSVYSSADRKNLKVSLLFPEGLSPLSGGEFTVRYIDSEEVKGKTLLAAESLVLP
ncbi:MAG TPA: hypothetical protein VN445_06900 [Rectinemataceae bacterium]|nr:hypothetical protein [Rectinemataceae bacterium]